MKCELIDEKADEIFSGIHAGTAFHRFLPGPHLPDTSKIKAFKLLSIAGAYWKAVRRIKQLSAFTRTAFFTAKELDAHLKQIEEAKKRDHRKLARIRPVRFQGTGRAGADLLPSQGGSIRSSSKTGCATISEARLLAGYTPHVGASSWKTSGTPIFTPPHFTRMEAGRRITAQAVNCPFHILIYKDKQHSYRDLPGAPGRVGPVYRSEPPACSTPCSACAAHAG